MAIFFPQVALEMKEGEPTVHHSSGGPRRSNLPSTLARLKRKHAFPVGTLVALLSILAIWILLSTCSYVLQRTVARRHEGMGRRLAAGEDEEEEDDLLVRIVKECTGWQEGLEDLAGVGFAREECQMTSHASSFAQQLQEILGELQPGETSSSSSSPPGIVGAASTELQASLPTPLLGTGESAFFQLPPEVPLEDALRLLVWDDDDEVPADVFATQDSGQPSPSTAKSGERRSMSPSACQELDPAKNRKMTPVQSPGAVQYDASGTTSGSGYMTASATTGQEYAHVTQQLSPPLLGAGECGFHQLPPEVPLGDALRILVWGIDADMSADVFATQDSGQPSPSTAKPGEKRSMSPSASEEPVSAQKRKTNPGQSSGVVQYDAVGATTSGHLTASATAGHENAQATQQHSAYSTVPSATEQAATSPYLGSKIPTASRMRGSVLARVPLSPVPSAPATLSVTPQDFGITPGSPGARPFSLPPPASPMPPNTHLYYRLPNLEPGTIPRCLNVAHVFDCTSDVSPHPHLKIIRHLLTQPSITPSQDEELITASEKIISYLYKFHRRPVDTRKLSVAAFLLSRRYLCLEALFTAVQLLGPAMQPEIWWPKLVQSIPTEFNRSLPKGLQNKAALSYHALATRLSAALAMLKKGIRPSLLETVHLKRELFNSDLVLLRFKDAKWDDWRNDDDGGEGTSKS